MKNFNLFESIAAFVVTVLAGVILGINPTTVVALAYTFYFSSVLATDIIAHIKEKKLPSIYEGIGDVFIFAAIVLALASFKYQNIVLGYVGLGCVIVDCILIYVQARVDGKSGEEAIKEVEKRGLKYTTKDEENADIEEGVVIRTEPKAGSTKTKGSTITIVESSGKEYLLLEDYTGKNYYEIKAKLELKGIKVEMKTKEVENTSDYKDKEEQIIDQEPKFDKEKETKLYAKDTVVLYIPEVDVYPDMVKEKWTLSKVQDFAKENNITLDITYKETTDVEENIILSQGRDPGDPIYNGYTLKVTISKKPEDKTEPTNPLLPSDDKTE